MKLRIAIWAGAGALVVVFWSLYISATVPPVRGTMLTLGYLTCPITLARHYPLSFYFVVLVNAATYGLAGVILEAMRGYFQQSRAALRHSS